jgi:L-fuculose-phosphate aldolase
MGARDADHRLREEIVATARAMNALDINRGMAGNVSARVEGGFLITPSGVAYDEIDADNIVAVTSEGDARGRLAPSSEWRFHRDIYAQRSDAGAIVHTHGPFATTLACLDRGIPAFHYMVAIAGGKDIRCAPYATFGTEELSERAVAALLDRRACLLAHHGAIAIGARLTDALRVAREVETLAEMYWRALQVAEPVRLPDEEMDRVLVRFATYGQATPE